VHAARRLAKEFGNDPGKITLKVDFSNAFNVVDRTEMIAQVYDKFPSLYQWVEYCYSHPAHLFFGRSHCKVWLGCNRESAWSTAFLTSASSFGFAHSR